MAAGAIIGKGGETIAAVQKETGAKVKMSKSHDFYPGMLTKSIHAVSERFKFKIKTQKFAIFSNSFLFEFVAHLRRQLYRDHAHQPAAVLL